ncbi:unnamed protein product [Allacma fusca]|uniref:Protein kinase domain-containing protein n=1 Tax=Allacma fusca TaxID=39272 RepID=A0A8J2PGL4_9HEXA|nr:unnamed protein product [Allacma fusca]
MEDSAGNPLALGDIVKTLGSRLVLQALPDEAKEEHAEVLADKYAVIHGIKGEDVDIEIDRLNIMARLSPVGLKFHRVGMRVTLGDDSVATIGLYVKPLSDVKEIKNAQRTVAWLHGMEETCGKTGRVVKILKNSEILVQFAWGPRYYYDPKALLGSSEGQIETQDPRGKVILLGTLIQIELSAPTFQTQQAAVVLPYLGNYSELPGMYAKVEAITIKPFSIAKKIWISCNRKKYYVNVESLQVVDTVLDENRKAIKVGDEIKLCSDLGKVKKAQTAEFGGWNGQIKKFLGQKGTVVAILPDVSEFTSLMIEVEFAGEKFTLNPQVVTNTSVTEKIQNNNELQEINRKDIECSKIKLGQGGFGAVYKGEWKQKDGSKQTVAIKKFHASIAAKFRAEAMEEAKTQFSLRHPNVVTLHGYSTQNDLWLIMDFVEGWDLACIINKEEKPMTLTDKKKVKLALEMCTAIAYIHQKGYLHCDIKPNNMMIDCNTEKLYICDFGIARYFDADKYDPKKYVTQYTNNMVGTPYYLAPECFQADPTTKKYKAPSTHSDVWSLGLVLYELFTQKMMVNTVPEFHLFSAAKVISDDLFIKKRLQDLPQKIIPVVTKALDFKRSNRQSAQELAEFFHEYLFDVTRS